MRKTSYEEITEQRIFIKIKNFNGVPALEVELNSLSALIQSIAFAISSGNLEIEKREVTVRKLKPPEPLLPALKKEVGDKTT